MAAARRDQRPPSPGQPRGVAATLAEQGLPLALHGLALALQGFALALHGLAFFAEQGFSLALQGLAFAEQGFVLALHGFALAAMALHGLALAAWAGAAASDRPPATASRAARLSWFFMVRSFLRVFG